MQLKENVSFYSVLGPLALALAAFLCLDTPVERTSYCPDCGVRKEWHTGRLLGLPLGWIKFTRESSTHLSELYREAAVVRPHGHRWRPSACPVLATDITSERGRKIVSAIKASRVVSFVRGIDQYTDEATAAKWHSLLSNAACLGMMDDRLHFCRFPAEGFATQAEFEGWWREYASALYRELEITPFICC